MKKKIILIIQARLTSSRFPSKVLKKINNKPLIFFLNERLRKCKNVDRIVFAIPNNNKNLRLKKYLERKNINFFLDLKIMFLKDIILQVKNLMQKQLFELPLIVPWQITIL